MSLTSLPVLFDEFRSKEVERECWAAAAAILGLTVVAAPSCWVGLAVPTIVDGAGAGMTDCATFGASKDC